MITTRADWRWRAVSIALIAWIVGYCLYHITKFRPFWPDSFTTEGMGDFIILMEDSRFVVEHGHTRAGLSGRWDLWFFPYAPPAVILFWLYGHLAPGVAWWIYCAIKLGSVFAILRCGFVYAGIQAWHWRWPVGLAALVAAEYFVHYDLRQQNINLVYVAMVAAALLPAMPAVLGGVLLALAATFKLYSLVFLPWLLWRRRFAMLGACLAALALLWGVLPLAVLGAATPAVFADWLAELANSGTPAIYTSGAPLVTLRHFVAHVMGGDPFAASTTLVLAALQLAWLALVAAWFVATRPGPAGGAGVGPAGGLPRDAPLRAGADAAVLMMLPLPFSTILQPTHGVPTVLAFVLIIAAAGDARRPAAQRAMLAALTVAAVVVRLATSSLPQRAGATFAILCLCVVALAAVVGVRGAAPRRAFSAAPA